MTWKPKNQDYLETINNQNPWHSLSRVPLELAKPIHRPLADVLWRLLLDWPRRRHQIILGPRRVGKTTVMYQTVQSIIEQRIVPRRLWWLRMDHPLLFDIDLGHLIGEVIRVSRATSERPVYIFLDELTYAAQWDLWLKTIYDEHWPVRIVGTSSATAAIRDRGTESGVGRWEEQHLSPYMFTEYLDLVDEPVRSDPEDSLGQTLARLIQEGNDAWRELEGRRRRFILTGGFPELLTEQPSGDEPSDILKSQRILRSDAIEKALYKDIPQAFSIQDPTKLERLLYTLAGQITGIFSPATLATDVELTSPTLEKYVKFLEHAFIVFTLPNFSPSEETVQRRGRKLFFVDGAVRNAALLRGLAPLQDPAEMGLLIENIAASHLYALSQQDGVRLYHWRHRGAEVDLVYDHPDDPMAFEITNATGHKRSGLRRFQEAFGKFRGCCYVVKTKCEPALPTFDEPGKIPLDLFLIGVGQQAEAALANRIGVRRIVDKNQRLLFEL